MADKSGMRTLKRPLNREEIENAVVDLECKHLDSTIVGTGYELVVVVVADSATMKILDALECDCFSPLRLYFSWR